jgi:hypothetical protein
MALAHRTSGHTASTSTAAAAATMIASSPPSPAPHPRPPVGPWGPNSSCRTCFSDFAAVLVVLVCFSCVGLCIHYAARVLLRCLDRRRRAAREAQAQEPKPASDADGGSAGASPVAAGVWAEAECAICLAELDDLEGGERVRVRVLPACGHGFHAACVEAWLATRASCPTCRAPSSSRSRPSRTTRAP